MFRRVLLLLTLLSLLPASGYAQPSEEDAPERLIADLASPSFSARQAASQRLATRGARAIPLLEQASITSSDRETVLRCVAVLSQILESREVETSRAAEAALTRISEASESVAAPLAKTSLGRWRMELCIRTVARLKRLGAAVGQPTTASDGSPEVYLQILKKDWKGSDSDLEMLPDLGRIGLFRVDETPISSDGLSFLTKCRSVEKIYLDQTRLDSRAMAIIAQAPHLKHLTLKGMPLIDRDMIEPLTAVDTLEYLSLDSCQVDSAILPLLARIQNLRFLDLSRTKIDDEGLGVLADLPRLQNLNLSGANISGKGVAELAKAPALDTLNLRGSQFGPQALEGVGRLAQVRYLILDEVDLSAADFSQLAEMRGLRRLDLANCQITDNNARSLASLEGVTYILLRGNQVSSTVRDQIHQQIPKTQILP